MMRRIAAEEAMRTMNATALGTGSLDKEAAARMLDGWSRAAGVRSRPRRPTRQFLKHAGIGIRPPRTPTPPVHG